ncbi:hypothetical protein GOP47_0009995 [Adiantum capillus-veneris]|uniref:polyribonucleotide nucleotidyltransferase n=1 Tax=Adiantum capillus-veneris TaxID=13818 RepID=A0A9D4UXN7_ADICA|nr:hypothetical protein GOP47_0009995 [Adiantum capillus-veneris]
MGAWAFALRSRHPKLNCRLDSRRLITNTAARLQEIVVEEPSFWRLFPAKGEVFEEQVEVGPHVVTFETGKLARFASGAVVMGIKDTRVLTTVVGASRLEANMSFMPLQVDYREKQYAQGRIPNTFMRREGAPKERELLIGRVIDRSIRPLFPKGYYYESQVMANVLCVDGEQDPDVLAACGASAALMVSDIPWNGPVGVVRIGRVDGKFVVNPSMDELAVSDLNLVYACTVDKTIMMETQAREITNNDLKDALQLAHAEATKLIAPQIRLASKVQNQKRSFSVVTVDNEVLERIRAKAEVAIDTVMGNPSYGKFERGKALSNIQADVEVILKEEGEEKCLKALPLAFDQVRKEVVRKNIFEKGERVDGRRLDEVRDLHTEVELYTPLHGSSLFSRGNTQVLCTVTLGAPEDAQKLDYLVGPPKKRFMLHYSFPPYCINEVGRSTWLNRREVGHGNLAEKALVALLPNEEEFPYSVRVTSEVMASDGSSSMATVCGGSLALMDAGVPLRSHVAGVSVGLITAVDETTGKITDYRILTDILESSFDSLSMQKRNINKCINLSEHGMQGLEDHVGDMDFKIAGTRLGITAIQLDIKPSGIPLDILCEALEPARIAREQILDVMEQEIREPKTEQKANAPRKGNFSVQREMVGRLIGPHGSTVKNIERTTGVRLSISEDGRVCVIAKDQSSYDQAKDMVDSVIGKEVEIGNIYSGCVTQIRDFGAFVEIEGGHQGLLHISELSHQRVAQVTDAVMLGQKLSVMCIGRDTKGNIKLSLKATMPLSTAVKNRESSTMVPGVERTISTASPANAMSVAETEREVIKCKIVLEQSGRIPGKLEETEMVMQNQGEVEPLKLHGVKQQEGVEYREVPVRVAVSTPECNGDAKLESRSEDARLDSSKKSQVNIDGEYEATVHQIRVLGAVLKLHNGELGKLFFDEETTKLSFNSGDRLAVRCIKMDRAGKAVFSLLKVLST